MATKSDRFRKKYFNAEELKASGPLVLEIEEERLEPVTDPKTGRTADKSVIAFVGTDQKLVLNGTNWDLIVEITGSSDSRDWPGHQIELYADRTSMGGKRVDCVRVRSPNGGRSAFAGAAASPPAPSPNERPALAGAASSPSSPAASERPPMDDEIPF
jgi:hypothetical protein